MSFEELFMPKYQCARSGNGYEVTTRGDKRFSSFYAKLECGRTIEEIYQCDIKGYGTIQEAKGKKPLNRLSHQELFDEFMTLWIRWAKLNPKLIHELIHHADQHNGLLTDMFATSDINQANALSIILNKVCG